MLKSRFDKIEIEIEISNKNEIAKRNFKIGLKCLGSECLAFNALICRFSLVLVTHIEQLCALGAWVDSVQKREII